MSMVHPHFYCIERLPKIKQNLCQNPSPENAIDVRQKSHLFSIYWKFQMVIELVSFHLVSNTAAQYFLKQTEINYAH